jgi:outer membrane lipoprotein-sorting protein
MKKTILFLSLIIITLPLFSQTEQDRIYEQKAVELLKKTSEKIKNYKTMEIDFSYTMENSQFNITETMNGKLLSKGDKYHMIVGDNIFISDGVTVWNYIDDLDEIHINYVENTEGGLTPTALLADFEKEYKGKFIKQETHKGKTVNIIDLVPNKPQSFFKFRLALDNADDMLVYTIAYDRHGGTYTYNLDRVRINQNISDDKFKFNKADFPADAEIVDLR